MLTLLNCYSLGTKHSETAKRKPGIFSETVSFKALWKGSIKQLRRKARALHYASVVDTSSTIIFSPAVCFLLHSGLLQDRTQKHQARRMAAEVWESEPRRPKSNRIQMGHPHPTSVKSKIRTLVFTNDLQLSSLYLPGVVLDKLTSLGDYETLATLALQYKITCLRREIALALCHGQKAQRETLSLSPFGHQVQFHLSLPTGLFPFPLCSFFL